jgi:hypothetical protein
MMFVFKAFGVVVSILLVSGLVFHISGMSQSFRSHLDTVIGPGGHISFPDLLDDFRRRNRAAYGDEIKRSIIVVR